MPEPVIVTCAPTGGIHTPTMSPYLPVTPGETARESVAAAEAGAAVIRRQHLDRWWAGHVPLGPGELAASDAARVRKIRSVVESLGRTVVTPGEARTRLGLKGADRVAF
ncbi:3-keto-5-aminohexanoate cleavage protein [Streptomyces sp. HNM0574]|uniref:3-keto-5-aminohexanoate cleavage protein n=1 Tax=Streptomyces sp. HNM0574 TaxID=2714954 RepID=UPI00146CAFCA|nr:3-keto-5-aminohexanoate cleavage protein [Streptomyces sp. HNM0574]NLU68257.1 3-keto-5-aminohexanoate cleavage protein [Streptomyces sp. HNM0574]